jgi:hypothetical protein
VTQGALLFLVAVFAGLSCWYASYRVLLSDRFAVAASGVIALLWSTLIFFVDRSIAMSVDKNSPRRLAIGIAIRLPFAALIAATLSTPLLLRISEPVLNAALRVREREIIAREARENAAAADLNGLQSHVQILETQLREQEDRLRQEPNSEAYRAAKATRVQADEAYETAARTLGPQIVAAQTELARLTSSRQPIDADLERARVLLMSIETWRRGVNARLVARDGARLKQDRIKAEWTREEESRRGRLAEAWSESRRFERQMRDELGERHAESARTWATLMRPSLINQYSALRRIVTDSQHPDAAALRRWGWGLHMIFFFVEAVVLLLKALWPRGPLDAAIAALDAQDEERVTLRANRTISEERALDVLKKHATRAWRGHHRSRIESAPQDIPAQLGQIHREWEAMSIGT